MKRFLSLLLTVAMVFSCMSFTALAADGDTAEFKLYGTTDTATSTYAHPGGKLVATAVPGATYYRNGVDITDEVGGITPVVSGTVALPVVAGPNNFTAKIGDVSYGCISAYGMSFTYNGIGADISGKTFYYGTTITANPDGITNLIDDNHPYVRVINSTTTKKVTGTNSHQFTSGMDGKEHFAEGYDFYFTKDLTTDFRILNITNSSTRDSTDADVNLRAWIDKTDHTLVIEDYTHKEVDTGIVINPGVWHSLDIAKNITGGGKVNVYIDGQLIAKTDWYDPSTTIPATLYSAFLYGDGTNTFVGTTSYSVATSAKIPVWTNKDGTTAGKAYVIRNDLVTNVPSISVADSGVENTIKVTETEMTEFTGFTKKILVNGKTPAELGIDVTDNGDGTYTFTSELPRDNAEVEVLVVDADGNSVNGIHGPLKATATVDITGSSTFAFYGTSYDSAEPYANAGSKMMVMTDITGGTFKHNGDKLDTVEEGAVDGTILLPVAEGYNTYTAEKDGFTLGTLSIYGLKAVADGNATDISDDFKAVDADTGAGKVGTVVAEGAMINDAHDYAVKITTSERAADPAQGVSHNAGDLIAKAYGTSSNTNTHRAFALGFYIDGTLSGDFNVLDVRGSYNNGNYWSGDNIAKRFGTLLVSVNTSNEVVITDRNDKVINTGYKVSPNEWHDLAVTANYSLMDKANIYIDGVLVAKATFNTDTYSSAGWVVYKPSGAGNGYVGDAEGKLEVGEYPRTVSGGTSKAYIDYHVEATGLTAPTIDQVTETIDEVEVPVANTVKVVGSAPVEIAGAVLRVFVNGAAATTEVNGDNLVIRSAKKVDGATVYAAVVDAEGNVVKNFYGTELKSAEITMDIEADAAIALDGNIVTINREALGTDGAETLAVVTVKADGSSPAVTLLDSAATTADISTAIANGPAKVFVWVWSTLKPLCDNLIG